MWSFVFKISCRLGVLYLLCAHSCFTYSVIFCSFFECGNKTVISIKKSNSKPHRIVVGLRTLDGFAKVSERAMFLERTVHSKGFNTCSRRQLIFKWGEKSEKGTICFSWSRLAPCVLVFCSFLDRKRFRQRNPFSQCRSFSTTSDVPAPLRRYVGVWKLSPHTFRLNGAWGANTFLA